MRRLIIYDVLERVDCIGAAKRQTHFAELTAAGIDRSKAIVLAAMHNTPT
jgi:hypothetical protein